MTTLAADQTATHQFVRMTRWVVPLIAFCFFALGLACVAAEAAGPIVEFRGATMGTTYTVKVSSPPTEKNWAEDTRLAIDRELREVNDQMSTYLTSSELSRFNASESTDWFDVSSDTAGVVHFALEVSNKTDGAFDVTVGPLVNRWSFGPEERTGDVPTEEEIQGLLKIVGYERLHVRLEPPALKKDEPKLQVDLSAIAKGHGVDRVVDLLKELGARNVFVEVGGEVRVQGAKQTSAGEEPWKVGIQRPDAEAAPNQILIAHPMKDRAMATSGDYRNYFVADGKRYSHTIHPATGNPVDHQLASVTVTAKTCMEADAWATAFSVLGPVEALSVAEREKMDVLLVLRRDKGVTLQATGELARYAEAGSATANPALNEFGEGNSVVLASEGTATGSFAQRMMPVALLTGIAFGAVLLAMAVGVIFGRNAISGSCGGLNSKTNPDGSSSCSLCSSPSDACKELREQMSDTQADASRRQQEA